MLFVKVERRDAQNVKKHLLDNELFDKRGKHFIDEKYIYFPVVKIIDDYEIVEKEVIFEERKDFKTLLREVLSDEELTHLKTAYDQIGSIAILEIDDELKDKEKFIAQTLLKTNNTVETVVKKAGHHGGTFRTQAMEHVAGVDTKESMTKENGVKLKINVEEVYYSPRLSTDRKRIAEQVGVGEEILVMFSGAAPYPCVLSKNTPAKRIVGVEINPKGHELGLENLRLNKIKNVELINGDANIVVPNLNQKFDRILMPLPKSAEEFLSSALTAAKKGTIIHFYDFLNENDFEEAYEKVRVATKKAGFDVEFLELVKCGQHAPHVYRICLDFKII